MRETRTELTPQYETAAQVWGRYFNAVPTAESGRRSPTPWNNGVREAIAEAVGVEGIYPDSEDSAIRVKFEDGSVLELGNPAQRVCAGFVRVIS